MIQRLKQNMKLLAATLLVAVPLMVPVATSADITNSLCRGLLAVNDQTGGGSTSNDCTTTKVDDAGSGLANLASNIINLFSIVVGVISVIMIIVGGFRYVTSGGESNNVSGAKNTIIYAIIGLVIVALAQFIVKFVLSKVSGTGLTSA
jgi:hypothetical protein